MTVFDAVKSMKTESLETPEAIEQPSLESSFLPVPVEAQQSDAIEWVTEEQTQAPPPSVEPDAEEEAEESNQASLFDNLQPASMEIAPVEVLADTSIPSEPLPDAALLFSDEGAGNEMNGDSSDDPASQAAATEDASIETDTTLTDENQATMGMELLEDISGDDELVISHDDPDDGEDTEMSPTDEPPTEAETETEQAETTETEPADENMPYFLVDQEKRPRRSLLATLLGMMLILLLSTLAASQYVYHQRDTLARNPELTPWLELMCEVAECSLTPHREPTAFELLERDVRFHPGHENALLISASFVNHADFSQPYPEVELILKNMEGKVVAQRRFWPHEYLNTEQPLKQGIAAGGETALLLEVSDPGLEAVSFEFNFL